MNLILAKYFYIKNNLLISNSSLTGFLMLIKIGYMCYVNSHGKKTTKQFNQTMSAQNCHSPSSIFIKTLLCTA